MSFILNMMGLDDEYTDIFNDCVTLYDEASVLIGNESDDTTPEGNSIHTNNLIKSPQKDWLNVTTKKQNKTKTNKNNKNTKTINEGVITSSQHIAFPQMFSRFSNRGPATADLTLEAATGITAALASSSLGNEETILEVQRVLDTLLSNVISNNVGSKSPSTGILGSVLGKTDVAASDFISSSKEELKNLLISLTSKFTDVGNSTKTTIIMVLILAILIVALRDNKKMLFMLTIPLLLTLVGIEKLAPLIKQLKDRISDLALVVHDLTSANEEATTEVASPEAQNDFEILSALPGLIFGSELCSSIVAKKLPSFVMKNYRNSKQGISDIMTLLTESIKFILEKTGYGSFYDKVASKILNVDNRFNDYTKKIFNIEMEMAQKRFNFTVDNYNILVDYLIEGESLLSTINVHKHGNGIFSVMSSTVARVRAFKKIFDDSGFMVTGLRQEPASVLFRGAPGVFKTQALQHMCHAVISAVIDPANRDAFMSNPEMFIYNRLIESEYWDAYTAKHIICMFDDLMQMKDVPGSSANEAMEIIRAINENTFVLHMADLASKGNTHFNSKFVFATTNSPTLDSNSIVDRNALLRRFDHVYTVEPMPEFVKDGCASGMTAKFDKSKLPMGPNGITSTNPDNIIRFRKYNLLTQTSTDEFLSFSQVVKEIILTYETKKQYFEQKLVELSNRREEYAPTPQINFSRLCRSVSPIKENIFNMMNLDTAMSAPLTSYVGIEQTVLPLQQASEWVLSVLEDHDYDDYYEHLASMNLPQLEEHMKVLYYVLNHASALNQHMLHKDLLIIMLRNFGYKRIMDLKYFHLLTHNKYQIEDLVMFDYKGQTSIHEYVQNTVNSVKSYYDGVAVKMLNLKNYIINTKMYKFYKKYSIFFKIGIILPPLVYVLRSAYKYMTGEEMDVSYQSGNGSKSRSKAPKKVMRKVVRKNFSNVSPQVSLSDDTQCRDILLKVIKGNSYELFLSASREEEFDKCGQVVFVHGNVCMMPHHFVDLFNDLLEQGHSEARIKLVSLYSKSIDSASTEMYLKDFIGFSETGCSNVMDSDNLMAQDLTLVQVKNMVHRPSLMKFISPSSYVQGLRNKLTCMIAKNSNVAEIISVSTNIVSEVAVASFEYEQYTIPKSFIYNVATKKGDCGAIVAIADTSNSIAKICGMHVAGTPKLGRGYAAIFSREDIIEGFKSNGLEQLLSENQAINNVAEKQCDDPLFGKFKIVKSDLEPITIPSKSKIKKSPLYGAVTVPFMKPSKLQPPSSEPVITNPWYNAYHTYNMSTSMGCDEMIESAAENYSDMLFHNSEVVVNPKVYSFDEAVLGIEGTTFASMSRGTSPGYPDCLDLKIKPLGRKFYFGTAAEYDMTGENATRLREEVRAIELEAIKGNRSEFVYVDYLKDELRDIPKVDNCKTRLFSASPLRLLILYRMYFGEFQRWFMDNRINNQSAVGVNVYSAETEVIVQNLCKFAVEGVPTVGAGDFKGFDGSENKSIHQRSLEIVQKFYKGTPEEDKVREVLWAELTNSVHYFNGDLLEWTASLPSGHPMTTIVNNMYNGISFRYCWQRAFENTPLQYTFNDNAWLITQGDDNVFCVRSDLTETFNEAVVSKYMAELGLNYTKEDKTTADSTLRTVHQVEFLKRKWVYNTKLRRHVAPLRLNRLLETLSWTKEGPHEHQIPRDNVNTILHELSLHGEKIFKEWSPKIINASQEYLDYYPKNTSYTSLIRTVANMELNI